MSLECLYSTVRNTSDRDLFFGFLPPHGHVLTVGEEFPVFGDVREAVFREGRISAGRFTASLEAALEAGDLEILNTPAPILYDDGPSVQAPKMLILYNGVLDYADPCWQEED